MIKARLRYLLITLLIATALAGCADVGYYAHVAHGQSRLLMARQPVSKVVADPATDPKLAARLRLSQEARQFASDRLDLPRNRSYTYYVGLDRAYVVWNVFATPKFSVNPLAQCFPIAGCVAYRGWFDQPHAVADAKRLRAGGNDVYVSGVPAYSTLGFFADPILSSMMRWDDDDLIGTIFHELAHQLIYVKGDTPFNESYASFVEQQGLVQWHQAHGQQPGSDRDQRMDDSFTQLVLDLRNNLKKRYTAGGSEAELAAAKQAEIEQFRQRYAVWRDQQWQGDHRYDHWVAQPINNATLLPFGLYDQWVPAFAQLFRQQGGAWPGFFQAVRELAKKPPAERKATLQALMPVTGSMAP